MSNLDTVMRVVVVNASRPVPLMLLCARVVGVEKHSVLVPRANSVVVGGVISGGWCELNGKG